MESDRSKKFKVLLNRVGPLLDASASPRSLCSHSDLHAHEIINHPEDSFRSGTHLPLRLYQFLCLSCLNPVPLKNDSKAKCFNYRLLVSYVIITIQLLMVILSIIRLKIGGLSIFKSGSVLYFSGAALGTVLLIRVTRKWPLMITHWELVEGYIGEQKYLRVKFLIISGLVIIPAIVTHVAYFPSSILYGKHPASLSTFRVLMTQKFPQVYDRISYSYWTAGLILAINFISTMTYCLMDQIILMTSLALAGYFEKFNARMIKYKDKVLRPAEWRTLRMNYIRLCALTARVDDCISHLLCLSFLIHVYILCVYLYQGVLNRKDPAERIYVILSFAVVLGRFLALCLTTTRVYEQSKTPLTVLYGVRQDSYCTEVELFTQQVLKNNVSLSGSHMFSMNRNFLLTIVGTIITFELVLVQIKEIANV